MAEKTGFWIKLNWEFVAEWRTWEVRIPVMHETGHAGEYHIWIEERPAYCDRGRWVAKVDARPAFLTPDAQEGFPRYYFDWERALAELEAWVNARAECKRVAL